MLKIFDLSCEKEWREIIQSAYQHDFYHTYDYHQLAKQNREGTPKLFVFDNGNEFVALPLIERLIDKDQNLIDYTSVYGYVGPVYSREDLSEESLNGFKSEFENHMLQNNVVSVFSRLHPLIEQNFILENIGNIEQLNETVIIDLKLSLEDQRKKYRKSNKSEINKLRRTINCRIAETEEELDKFVEIYTNNMKRVNASNKYFFDKDYFKRLLNARDFKSELILAFENDKIMAGAIFIYTQKIVQYHLAGTAEEYLHQTPMKLILDEVRLKSTKECFDTFHLGGGVGSQQDSLFRFKSGFSDNYKQFNLWKYIVNDEVYNELVAKRKNEINDTSYFPLYRG
ncbi:MAG: GNAT family N-acetyltransferase [Bacteroidales bacterium]|nr:GNAT family N-acetyltransferase [Bacteroidales bacterium]